MKHISQVCIALLLTFTVPASAQVSPGAVKADNKTYYTFIKNNGTKFTGKITKDNDLNLMIDSREAGLVIVPWTDIKDVAIAQPAAIPEKTAGTKKQNYKATVGQSEISVGKGTISVFTPLFSSISYSQQLLTFSYRYHVSHTLTFGLGIGMETQHGSGQESGWFTSHSGQYVELDASYFSVVPEMTWSYLDKSRRNCIINAKLYGSVALGWVAIREYRNYYGTGYVAENKNVSSTGTSFQVTPIGLRVGRGLAGYIEFGIGYKGLVNLGIDARFPSMHPGGKRSHQNL